MITTAAGASRCLAANATSGVGVTSGKNLTPIPAAANTPAVSSANMRLSGRASKPNATGFSGGPLCLVIRWSASPLVVRMTVARFIRPDPGPTSPRIPAVPKVRGSPIASAIAARSPASTMSRSAPRVLGSGSPSIHRRVASSRSFSVTALTESARLNASISESSAASARNLRTCRRDLGWYASRARRAPSPHLPSWRPRRLPSARRSRRGWVCLTDARMRR